MQEPRAPFHPVDDGRGEALVFGERELEHVIPLAPDPREALVILAARGRCLAAVRGRQQGDRLQEVSVGDLAQDPVLRRSPGSLALLLPVLAQVELVGRERRGKKLEDRQGDAAGVDLLEHLAYRAAAACPAQLDNRQLVGVEAGRDTRC